MSEKQAADVEESSSTENCIKFSPSMSIQRYSKVLNILIKECLTPVKKVIDFGCSEMCFVRYLKSIDGVREIALVDVDINVLNDENNCYRKAAPQIYDYTKKRFDPLSIFIYHGSVAQQDSRLLHYDAVSCIEIIEHLTEDVLKAFPETIFGYLKPKLVVITTPNADFNVLFPNFKKFRHWDHKFEWTRKEFNEWCENVIKKYPNYTFETDGVGKGPAGSDHLGFCTQIATFRRQNEVDNLSFQICENYSLVHKYEFPFRTVKEVLAGEFQYQLNKIAEEMRDEDLLSDGDLVSVPLQDLFLLIQSIHPQLETEQQFIDVVESTKFKLIKKDSNFYVSYILPRTTSSDEDFT